MIDAGTALDYYKPEELRAMLIARGEAIRDLETTQTALREMVDFGNTADARARRAEMLANYWRAQAAGINTRALGWQQYTFELETRASKYRRWAIRWGVLALALAIQLAFHYL